MLSTSCTKLEPKVTNWTLGDIQLRMIEYMNLGVRIWMNSGGENGMTTIEFCEK